MKYIAKCKKTYLKSPLTASASSIVLRELKDSKDNDIALSDLGDWFVLVIKQSNTTEMVKCDGISTAADGTATLSVATNGRNLDATYPYAGSSTGFAFSSGAEAILTNDPLTMFQFGSKNLAQTWALLQTFEIVPYCSSSPVNDGDLTNKSYVDAVVAGTYPANRLVVSGTSGETIVAGNLVYLKTSDGEWYKCDADTATTVENVLLGIAQGAGTDGGTIANGVLIRGYDNNQTGLTANQLYYAGNTAGAISSSAGTTEVTIGFSLSTTEIYFSPGFNQHITEDIQDALVGTSGTPSAANKYVTDDDVSDAGASGKIVRATGTALPALDGSNIIGVAGIGFGDGSDGDVTISAPTTLTRDMYYNNLIVNDVLTTGNYRIFVKGSLSGTGTIQQNGNDGSNGGNGSGDNGGAGGSGGTAVTGYFSNIAGGAGGSGASNSGSNGNNGIDGTDDTSCIGDNGSAGGDGGEGTGSGTKGSGGSGGTASIFVKFGQISFQVHCGLDINASGATVKVKPQAGAAGGGGGSGSNIGTTDGGGGGGGGGATGGLVFIAAATWAGTFTIKATGGNGGNGGNAIRSTGGHGGGGAGGNGGCSVVIYTTKTWTGSYDLSAGTGGAAGSGTGTGGAAGSNGTEGTSYEISSATLLR